MNQLSALQQALQLSDEIITAIQEEDWDRVDVLDVQRSSLMDSYYTATSPVDVELTRELKQKNDEIVSCLQHLQQKIRSEQLTLKQSRKATKAYQSNT
ncbi:MAG: flagellar protein FliT [Gammaproteobacteria bacterium]|nr:flagellar protein FliT [Gammaproteobacteria bacterium]MBL6999863.1 flagellar protein FliT [Gammaproteobacteria bacterium]